MASTSKALQPKTASIRVIEQDTGTHDLTITNFSFGEVINEAEDDFIRSTTFNVGGYSWTFEVGLYNWNSPDGTVSIYLLPMENLCVNARAIFSFLDQNGNPTQHGFTLGPCIIVRDNADGEGSIVSRRELEDSLCLANDSLTVRCILTVVTGSYLQPKHCCSNIWPPSELHVHLGNLLESGDGTDVTIEVDGETFRAHKAVLAARSPIFRAELLGPMKEATSGNIVIKEMNALVFKILLKFIYTDCLSEVDLLRGSDISVFLAEHLLSASDRYDLGKLRLLCEEYLWSCIVTENVASIFVFAEEHDCFWLKEACLEFMAHPEVLPTVLANDEFQVLVQNCPTILKEIPVQKKRRM